MLRLCYIISKVKTTFIARNVFNDLQSNQHFCGLTIFKFKIKNIATEIKVKRKSLPNLYLCANIYHCFTLPISLHKAKLVLRSYVSLWGQSDQNNYLN